MMSVATLSDPTSAGVTPLGTKWAKTENLVLVCSDVVLVACLQTQGPQNVPIQEISVVHRCLHYDLCQCSAVQLVIELKFTLVVFGHFTKTVFIVFHCNGHICSITWL